MGSRFHCSLCPVPGGDILPRQVAGAGQDGTKGGAQGMKRHGQQGLGKVDLGTRRTCGT